jgi:4-amino-4-deoxychorismate lyase
VAGVARAEVLSTYSQTRVGELTLDALQDASEIFLSSSVRGILPVRSLSERDYAVGDITRRLQRHWRDLGFSMEQGG